MTVLILALALATPASFAYRMVRHHAKQHAAIRAWERELER